MIKETITANYYWGTMLKHALKSSGYLPKDLYYLITTNKDLEKMITPEIVRNWYVDEKNLDLAMEEIIYTRRINTHYFTQSGNTNDLEECIMEYCQVVEFKVKDYDEQAVIRRL